MNYLRLVLLIPAALWLAGCETRSISDSGYRDRHAWRPNSHPLYRGELSEFDLLGGAPAGADTSPENLARVLAHAEPPQLRRGEKVILIQSGAHVPDTAMTDEAGRYFAVAPFSGVPPAEGTAFGDTLRLRAAQGGYRYIVCYWGVLESAQLDREGKAISWVPIVGVFIPDQKQQMRLRMKALVLDVATGAWRMVAPETHADTRYNSGLTRESTDQQLVQELKARGYRSLVAQLVAG
jgi:ribosomal protein S16